MVLSQKFDLRPDQFFQFSSVVFCNMVEAYSRARHIRCRHGGCLTDRSSSVDPTGRCRQADTSPFLPVCHTPHHSEIFSGQETYLKNYNTYNEKSLLSQRKFLFKENCGKERKKIKIGFTGVPEQATPIQFSSECML